MEQINFTPDELKRYERHFLLPEVGLQGQEKLKQGRILCVGLGGLGSPVALYLAAAGIGSLGLLDDDWVDLSNLQRQIIYNTTELKEQKVVAASRALQKLNPHVELHLHKERLKKENAFSLLEPYDIIVDASDNFPTRYLIHDAAFFLKKPVVYGSLFQFEGYCTLFHPKEGGPCYRCLFPEPPDSIGILNCTQAGVLGVLPGIIGTLQAAETLKWILKVGDSLQGRLLHVHALNMKFREFQLRQDPSCPLCGKEPTITKLTPIDQPSSPPTCSQQEVALLPSISVEELQTILQGKKPIRLIDVRELLEYNICHLPKAELIPLGVLPSKMTSLHRDEEIYLYCRSGGRSAQATEFLQRAGFSNVFNVEGGILAWSERIDPFLPKY